MLNTKNFTDLIPYILRSVPYIHQSHTCKAYCALEHLYASKSHLSDEVWHHCTSIIREDEPKVDGLIIPELLEMDQVVDQTSGRNFGPDWILGRGLMPLSYWAMQKKVKQTSFAAVMQEYIEKSLDKTRYLGHEISVLSAYWQFYQEVIVNTTEVESHNLFLQRFTEFVTATYTHGEGDVVEHPPIDKVPSEEEILYHALCNPGFFGHHVLAHVWGTRLKSLLSEDQVQLMHHSQMMLIRGTSLEESATPLQPLDKVWSEEVLDENLTQFFLEGPHNIHQITLAEALVWCWSHYPQYRGLVAANLQCFTDRVRQ